MENFRPVLLTITLVVVAPALAAAQEKPADEAKPSAELIIDAEETIIQEPSLAPGEEPVPPMDGGLPGEQNIFGSDLFGTGTGIYAPRENRIPDRLPVLEDPKEAERKMRIKLRKIKAVLDRDPRLVELEQMAERAPTPEDRRAARRAYYTLFFDKVRRADASLKAYADKLEQQSLVGLYQTRVEPTWPLQPPPLPQPSAKLIPAPEYPSTLPEDEQPVRLR